MIGQLPAGLGVERSVPRDFGYDALMNTSIVVLTGPVETQEAAAALEELSAAFDRNRIEFLVEKNQAYLIDNRRVVHGRTPFSPTFSESDRHLKRILGMRRT